MDYAVKRQTIYPHIHVYKEFANSLPDKDMNEAGELQSEKRKRLITIGGVANGFRI